jgi:hypothetical protein
MRVGRGSEDRDKDPATATSGELVLVMTGKEGEGIHHLRPMTEREKSASAGLHFRPLPRSTRSGGSEDLEAAGPLGNRPCIRAREGIRDWPEYAARIKGPGRDIKS